MFIPSIKSKKEKRAFSVQTITLMQNALSFGISRETAQPASQTTHFKKNSTKKIYQLLVVMIATLFFVSCQKEELTNPVVNSTTSGDLSASAATNTPPSVDAGPAQRVVYSTTSRTTTSSATLYGRASDSQGPVTVLWKQVRGNSTAVIAKPTNDTTTVSGLLPGVYTFILTVTDNNGVARMDSAFVTVLQKMTWTIEGKTREALVHPPTGAKGSSPVIFAFHGHGGTDLGFAERNFEINWPEAIVVYPQGAPTKSHSDKSGKDPGWQSSVGEVNSNGVKDQDLKFFDAMMATFKSKYSVNTDLVFAHGWSNGGEFVYNVLWAARGTQLRALAPAAATLGTTSGKRAMPIIHIAGTNDRSVSYNSQQQTVQADRTLDKCASTGTTWATGPAGLLGTQYASTSYSPGVVSLKYDGDHNYPFTVPPYIIKFFKQVAGVK